MLRHISEDFAIVFNKQGSQLEKLQIEFTVQVGFKIREGEVNCLKSLQMISTAFGSWSIKRFAKCATRMESSVPLMCHIRSDE